VISSVTKVKSKKLFLNSFDHLLNLQHKALIKILGVILDCEAIVLVTEYSEAVSLYDKCKAVGNLNDVLVWKTFKYIARAVRCLHRDDILHKMLDWKTVLFPLNSDVPKLGNYGLYIPKFTSLLAKSPYKDRVVCTLLVYIRVP